MNQLDELKSLRIDPAPPGDGLALAMEVGGVRRRRVQRIALAGVVVVAAAGIAIPSAWPSNGDTQRVFAATPSTAPNSTPPTSTPPPSTSSAADQAVLHQLVSVLFARSDDVSIKGLIALPTKVSGDPLTFDGKPGIFFYGAEYSPFSAAQRWPLVLALSRFGTWSTLNTTTSSATDVYKSTPTFTFFGSSYSSPYLSFHSVETESSQPAGNGYQPLQTPTAEQTALVTAYDKGGSIPFIDFGNTSVLTGASYDTGVLKGLSASEIAVAATNPSTVVGRSILGTASTMTAAICKATGGQPAAVCDSPTIAQLRAGLG